MDKIKECLVGVLKDLKIKPSDSDYDGIFFVDNELANARNRNEPRKNIINAFLWNEEAIKFIRYFIEKLHPEEIALAIKERSDKDYFINKEYTKIIKSVQLVDELRPLYTKIYDCVFGVRLKINGSYYSFTNTGHENELEFNKELVELIIKVK